MESPENDNAVFRPSHKPWKSIKPISTFPPPQLLRDLYEKIPKRRRLKLPALNTLLRLIPGLEKTGVGDWLNASRVTINVKHDSVLCRQRNGSGLSDRKKPAMGEGCANCGTSIASN
jgi:hypothetical protein